MNEILIATLVVGVIWNTVVYFFKVKQLIAGLEKNSPDIYQALGRPTLFSNNSPGGMGRLIRLIVSHSDYEGLDKESSDIASTTKWLLFVHMILILGLVLFVISS